jgi:tetratricopeptide (TPR) repeat protein
MNRCIIVLTALVLGLPISAAMAETVEVASGIMVTKKIYGGPDNEAPFHGFAEKSALLRQTDDIFISMTVQAYGSRARAFEDFSRRGWEALAADDFRQAGMRFNQASLFLPGQSQIFHGFAVIAYTHFNDPQFADELFKIALKQPGALAGLNADYGHMLLAANRSDEAEPVLEQAVKDTPDAGDAWTDLGLARLRNGNPTSACLAADRADRLQHAAHAAASIKWIWREAKCSGH